MSSSCWRERVVSGLALIALTTSAGCGRAFEDSDGMGAGGEQGAEGGASSAGRGSATSGGQGGFGASGAFGGAGGMTVAGASTGGNPEFGCSYQGQWLSVGTQFKSADFCNTCTCLASGAVSCTNRDCSVCPNLREAHETALEEARRCDPALSVEQCTAKVSDGFECGCVTFVNPANADALATMKEIQVAFSQNGCALSTSCSQCAETLGARCSPEGRCESIHASDHGCEVGGVRYPNGATGIPDPVSCNTCTCTDQTLSCTEINCPNPCPVGTGFGTSCAQCAPNDDCQVVAYGCYGICIDSCDNIGEVCVGGLCRPGFCG